MECRWCWSPVRADGRGGWVHFPGGYICRDADNVMLSTSAEPAPTPPPQWPLSQGRR